MELGGTCDSRFDAVRGAFENNFDPERAIADVGASVAVTIEGELVVDLWGGTVDTDAANTGNDTGAPWQADTIVNVWSNTKTVSALALLMLADQNEIDLYAPVAKVWPEFAVNDKSGVLVRHVMAHSAGLPTWDPPIDPEELYDWDKATGVLAAMTPWWEPGTASGYHALTQGYLEGELVRRVTGQTIGEFVRAEITGPLGVDFHIGTPDEHHHRIGHVIPPREPFVPPADPTSIAFRAIGGVKLEAEQANTAPWRRAEIPAAGGHGNARSLAQIHAPMACGGTLRGVKLLSPTGADPVFDEQWNWTDQVFGIPMRHGIGFGLPSEFVPLPNPRSCFWGGWGGSITVIDIDARMTFSYVMNRMAGGTLGDDRGMGLLLATYGALLGAG
ncbi:serine hydrolase domain-containing protein [Desertimonas flava]|uniref:serine hydrolase domain-containing protein n=1 Tax=Desertimonas flava TaxID=2064846 RepID=UPI000E356337|nr:serine hydrolase domain-containing protein [Desertimonas flava]